MAQAATRLHLLCYDIRDPKRLGRVHRVAVRHAVPIQYSVFLLEGDAARVARVLRDVAQEIDPRVDDVRVYPLPSRPEPRMLGRGALPEGVQVFDAAAIERLFAGSGDQLMLDAWPPPES
jgi:CRISPR-associated protein Cas2